MPIHVSYFGKQDPKTATAPISSYQWDKPPFGQEAKIDWKTGKVRSALYQEEKPVDPVVVPLLPFDIKVGVSEKTPVIQVWMPRDTTRIVGRNGYDIAPPEIYTELEKEGWQNLLLPMDRKATYYVYLNVVEVEGTVLPWPTGVEGATWELTAVTEPVTLTDLQTRQQTPVLLAIVINGIVFQTARGRINTYYSMPDGEALPALNKSLEHPEDGSGIQQVRGFNNIDDRIVSNDVKEGTIRDFMMRFDLPDGRAQVSYLDGEGAAEYVFPHGTIIWGRVIKNQATGEVSQFKMTWDLPNRIWVEEAVPQPPINPAEDPEVPLCGHPGNGTQTNPSAEEEDHPGGGALEEEDHPGDAEGGNGVTPECDDSEIHL